MDFDEYAKTKQSLVFNFITAVNSAKHSFIVYNVIMNRLESVYQSDLDVAKLNDNEREQLSSVLVDMQYHFLDAQIYYKSLCKKKSIATGVIAKDDTPASLDLQIQGLLNSYVPEREPVKIVLQGLTDFIVSELSADMQTELETLRGIIGKK